MVVQSEFVAMVRLMSRLVIATHNTHKTGEIREILAGRFDEVIDLTAFPAIPPAIEDGASFEANARIKALHAARFLPGDTVLADDSGLEVDALDGAPGVYSARYGGPDATDLDNRVKLLQALDGVPGQHAARFRCVLALARDGQVLHLVSGAVEGRILPAEQGDHGFGYDPLFQPDGHDQSFGQLPAATKHAISHRGRALHALLAELDVARG